MITDTMYIGSGDVTQLMSGINTKGFQSLLKRFVSGVKPYYNALSSPIDACRTGAILELRYCLTLSQDYFYQYVVKCSDMDVFKASLDFAKLSNGKVCDFDELKSISLNDYMDLMPYKDDYDERLKYIKKRYKHYYNQVQEQLMCAGIEKANLVFLSVYTYNDEDNIRREIQPYEYIKTEIYRDEEVIQSIRDKAFIFQQIKNLYK